MLIGTTYNSLIWDSPEKLPFPEELKILLGTKDLVTLLWNSSGLPEDGAKYSVSGGKLYYEESADGQMKLEQIDFTGQFMMGTMFLNNSEDESSYYVSFLVTVLKGDVHSIEIGQTQAFNTKDIKSQISSMNEAIFKKIKIKSSWWYKWIYFPYSILIRWPAILICWILLGLRFIVEKIALFLTPI